MAVQTCPELTHLCWKVWMVCMQDIECLTIFLESMSEERHGYMY
jgi:hypothetical protein